MSVMSRVPEPPPTPMVVVATSGRNVKSPLDWMVPARTETVSLMTSMSPVAVGPPRVLEPSIENPGLEPTPVPVMVTDPLPLDCRFPTLPERRTPAVPATSDPAVPVTLMSPATT